MICVPDKQTKNRHTHTLITVSTYCFSTAIMATEGASMLRYTCIAYFVYNGGQCLLRGTSWILIQIRVNVSV